MRTIRVWPTAALAYLALGYGSLHAQGNVPAIDNLAPASRAAGSGQFTLSVTGTNFRDGATVHWRGSPKHTEPSADGTRLNATILANDILQAGTVEITVVQRVGQQVRTSAPATFTITASGGGDAGGGSTTPPPTANNPSPALSSLSPVQARIGGPPFDLNVIGTGFVQGADVRWGGAARPTTRVSATHLVAKIPASDITLPGPVQITVFNPSPGGGTSAALSFERIHYAPTIASLNPRTVTQGETGFTLTVGGANYLAGGSTVRWNGDSLLTAFVSPSQLAATVPAARIATAGDVAVTVVTRAGQSSKTSAPATLTISPIVKAVPALVVTAFQIGGSANPARVSAGTAVPLHVARTGLATHWRVSRNSFFRLAPWQTITTAPTYTFAASDTSLTVPRTLHFQYRYVSGSDTTLSAAVTDDVIVRPAFTTTDIVSAIAGRTRGVRHRRLCTTSEVMTGIRWRQDASGVIAAGIICAGREQALVGNTTGGTLYAPGGCSSQNQVPTAVVTVRPPTLPGFIGLISDPSGCAPNPLGSSTTFDPNYAVAVPGTYRGSGPINVHCPSGAFPIGMDVYVETITLVVDLATGIAGVGFVCAKPE